MLRPWPSLLILALALFLAPCQVQAQDCPAVYNADLMFGVDTSDSVDASLFESQKTFVKKLTRTFAVGKEAVRVSFFSYGDKVNVDPFIYQSSQAAVDILVDSLKTVGGVTAVHTALESTRTGPFSQSIFGVRPETPTFFILFVSGPSSDSTMLRAEMAQFEQLPLNITVIVIGLGNSVKQAELELIASTPGHVINIPDVTALESYNNTVLTLLCPPPPPPQVRPGETMCTAREILISGQVRFVKMQCKTIEVYPEAICKFYRTTDGGAEVPIEAQLSSTHTIDVSGLYFKSISSANIQLPELGEGTHSFHGYCFPNVTSGLEMVNATTAPEAAQLSFPRASHSCPPNLLDDYLCGRPVTCNCTLESLGRPSGYPGWYDMAGYPKPNPLPVTYDNDEPNVLYTCVGRSALGRSVGSSLKIDIETECN